MSDVRIIKKYPNRRLYDTAISSYITLADVKALVIDGVDFQVIDAKTKGDLTRSILLQIISEEEEGGEPIFSSDLLARIIRSYGGAEQDMLTSYLEKSMELWVEQQRVFRERTRTLMDNNPISMLTQFAEHNLAMWQAMSGMGTEDRSRKGGAGSKPSSPSGDKPGQEGKDNE
ncbi:polyhydroxyalkanoate synthesis repressor PhaR [Alkalilimnicola ehrlichii]|uniref:Polyhydroxyalkanoate synthesis repressor PhaR n=1 Tax=Alkalilimnicola ehrlichii TaxID=351052 RepID=A0A3E0X143_9GAMM|nr:polyhydroxyalkanoate synthesis repressor PhaR [Alkalilimnicola ehrlichii]RFA31358.1 polyhydroxyalkanoate synthesis repressor PhaR [Alkalilimnicola ehrlichii]RFA39369.1 polyhydroxyalkanoate synthesis repressor PhaR [Alkalilimnicola ehrlichii]